jgi:hypothetical protein
MGRTTIGKGIAAMGLAAFAGCEVVGGIAQLGGVYALGALPAEGFSIADSEDYGLVRLTVGGYGLSGLPLIPPVSLLDIGSGDSDIEIESSQDVQGFNSGDLLLLSDGSASLENGGCTGCPTDPGRHRVEAVSVLAKSLHGCAAGWRIGLMEFGPKSTDGFTDTSLLVDYTTETEEVISMSESLASDGGTPLWDSLSESLDSLSSQMDGSGDDIWEPEGKGLVVISDGEDTMSYTTAAQVVALAQGYRIPVNVVALGESSDLSDGYSSNAIGELRRLAKDTGGFYASVGSADELPLLAEAMAGSFCGGYTDVDVRFLAPPASGELVTGSLGFPGSPIRAPFSFRAP